MNARLAALGSIVLALGCTRSFSPVQNGDLANGTPCAANGACASGICADGVCCEKSCAADETCNASRQAGTCVVRRPGDPCGSDAQCKSAFCVDGVCCETACGDPCEQCNAPGNLGRCVLAEDNTDPRGDCGATCSACFAGLCGPADIGTDPKFDCDSTTACGYDQTCHFVGGASCSQDGDCALDTCFAGRCLEPSGERIDYEQALGAESVNIVPLSVSTNAVGDEAIAYFDFEFADDSSGETEVLRYQLKVAEHRAGTSWTNHVIQDFGSSEPNGVRYAEVVYLGRHPYVIYWVPPQLDANLDFTCGPSQCEIDARTIGANGEMGPVEVVATGVQEGDNIYDALNLNAYLTLTGDVVLGWQDQSGFHTRYRSGSGWGGGVDLPRPADYVYASGVLGTFEGRPVFVSGYTTPEQDPPLYAMGFDVVDETGTIVAADHGTAFPCNAESATGFIPARGALPSTSLHFGIQCYDNNQAYVVTVDAGGSISYAKLLDDDSGTFAIAPTFVEDPDHPLLGFGRVARVNGSDVGVALPDGSNFGVLGSVSLGSVVSLAINSARGSRVLLAYSLSATTGAGEPLPDQLYVARLMP